MMKYGLIVVQYILSFYLFIFSCCAWMEFLHLCFYVTGCFCVFVSSSLCMFKCTMFCFNCYGKLHEIHMSCCVLSFPYSCVRCCAWGTIETIWKLEIPLSQLEFLEPQLRDFMYDLAFEPWREVGRPEGLCEVKGDLIPWVLQVDGSKSLLVGINVGIDKVWIIWQLEPEKGGPGCEEW